MFCRYEYRATNLDDPEVRKKIIDQAVELEAVKKADGSLQYFEPLDFAPIKEAVGELSITKTKSYSCFSF